MVDVMGHVAMGLLWALPAWFLWSRHKTLGFLAVVVPAAMLPDVDLWLQAAAPSVVHHHGVTHTVVFVSVVAVAVGAGAAAALPRRIDRWLGGDRFDASDVFAFVSGGILVGGLSHLFADMLSAPDKASPIEPFWPFFDKPWSVDLIWYNSPWWNAGLLAVAVALHLGLAYASEPEDHSYRAAGERR